MARLAVAHTRAVTKGPPDRREGWKIRVGSFDSPPLTNGLGKLLYPTVNQDGEVIAGLVVIPESAVHKFCPDAPSSRRNRYQRGIPRPTTKHLGRPRNSCG